MYQEIAANKRKTVLIIGLFVCLVVGMSWLFSRFIGEPAITPFILIAGLVYALITYFKGASMALAVNRAQEIEKADNPRLWRLVENLAITDGLPMPQVFIMDDPALNAFATGRDPAHAVVCVTSGLLDAMEDDELQGVLAHELGHVKNYDIRVSTMVFALVAIVGLLADAMLRISWFSNDRDEGNNNQLFFIVGLVAAILAPIVAVLIQLAVSRRREFLADATGALTTRYPEGLISALKKIEKNGSTLRHQNTSTAHLFFSNPLKGHSLTNLFSTHPPIEERIVRLEEMGRHA